MEKVKQVIVVRTDLKMPKGKLAAQVAHASLGAVLKHKDYQSSYKLRLNLTPELQAWLAGSFFKVVLKVEDEEELNFILNAVSKSRLPYAKIVDAGHTFFDKPTFTCLGIGPAVESVLDKITGHLKLL